MATETRHFKFDRRVGSSDFSRALSTRVDAYFRDRGISRYANFEMVAKTVLGFAAWIATYIWLLTADLGTLGVVAVFVVHGFAQLYMGLNIAHDANHGAYSRRKGVNKALGHVFDLVGLSSYMWRLMHNHSHHFFVNIRGADSALWSGKILRFSPHDPRRPCHRFQHLYAPILYCLPTLDWVFAKDYRGLLFGRFGNSQIRKHPRTSLAVLFFFKAFYYTYMLVIPMIFVAAPWYSVILGFTVMHFCLGFSLAVTFQPNHFTEKSGFAEPDDGGHIASDYIRHIFDNTCDYARGNSLANWSLGGLNLHVMHHLFPQICHVHYPALTEILKTTAEEHGFVYHENKTVTGAFLAHLKWLKILGSSDPGTLETP